MSTAHHETGHDHGPKPCHCSGSGVDIPGIDHDRDGNASDPPTILGQPAATCSACGAVRRPPRAARRRPSVNDRIGPEYPAVLGSDSGA